MHIIFMKTKILQNKLLTVILLTSICFGIFQWADQYSISTNRDISLTEYVLKTTVFINYRLEPVNGTINYFGDYLSLRNFSCNLTTTEIIIPILINNKYPRWSKGTFT